MNGVMKTESRQGGDARQVLALAGIAVGLACLGAAGALLWSHEGARVFIDIVMSGVAACL